MEIAVWSRVRHQSGVTSTVAVLSILWARCFQEKVAVTTNHLCNEGIFDILQGLEELRGRSRKKDFCYQFGEPEYFRKIRELGTLCTEKLQDDLRMVCMTGEYEADLFAEGSIREIRKEVYEDEVVFIDTASGCSRGSQKILKEADLTVVMLPPDKEFIDRFFREGLNGFQNCFFILGNYSSTLRCYPSYFERKFGIHKDQIGFLPHDAGLKRALSEGKVMAYLDTFFMLKKEALSYSFSRKAQQTLEKLRAFCLKRRETVCCECEEV